MKMQVPLHISLAGSVNMAARKIPATPSKINEQQVIMLFAVNSFAARVSVNILLLLVDGGIRYAGV